MADEVFEQLLDGALQQASAVLVNGRPSTMLHLSSLVYSNNQIAHKSISKIIELAPNLTELILNNIKDSESNKGLVCELLEAFLYKSRFLMKLKLSNINLCNDEILNNVNQLI